VVELLRLLFQIGLAVQEPSLLTVAVAEVAPHLLLVILVAVAEVF
jgi:hypothetical protein